MVRTWHFHCHGLGSIPGQRTEILQTTLCSQKKKKLDLNYNLYVVWFIIATTTTLRLLVINKIFKCGKSVHFEGTCPYGQLNCAKIWTFLRTFKQENWIYKSNGGFLYAHVEMWVEGVGVGWFI